MGKPLQLPDMGAISFDYLATQRRRLGVWLVTAGYPSGSAVKRLREEYPLRAIDLMIELGGQLTDEADKPLGVFDQDDLAKWIRQQSYMPPPCPIIIHDIEPLLTTFGKPGTIGFFRLASQLDPRSPVVVISCLTDLVSAAGFPLDRIWHISTEEGIWKQ